MVLRTTAYADELLEYDLPTAATGPSGRRRSSATGSAARRAPRSCSASRRPETTSPSSRRAPTRSSAPPSSSSRPSIRSSRRTRATRRRRTRATPARARSRSARRRRRRPASSPACTRSTRSTASSLPIWVADYVLMDYGTGAIMAVPAHDERDGEFAETFALPRSSVIDEDGKLVNSGRFDGLPAEDGARAIVAALEPEGRGKATVHYRLRDWSVSRQRYWGCPIPFIHCEQLRRRAGARGRAAGDPARHRGLRAEGQVAARRERGVHGGRLPAVRRPGAARSRHDGHVRRLVLVLPALHRLAQRRGAVRPLRRRLLAARLASTSAASTTPRATCSTRASSSRR